MASGGAADALTISVEENYLVFIDPIKGNISRHSFIAESPSDIERGGLLRINVGNLLAGLKPIQLGRLRRSEPPRCSHIEIVATTSPNEGEIRRQVCEVVGPVLGAVKTTSTGLGGTG